MYGVWMANIMLAVAFSVIAYISWKQHVKYRSFGPEWERQVRFQRNITWAMLAIVIGNIAIGIWNYLSP
jgi:hypothetical protein